MRTVGVTAVIPCHNDQANLYKLLGDLGSSARRFGSVGPRIVLRAIVVDNASKDPIPTEGLSSERDGLQVSVERLDVNAGGSGGFSRGISRALLQHPYDLVWLLDSDARVDSLTMAGLVARMEQHPDLVAVGPALADPVTREVHEIGGSVNRHMGRMGPKAVKAEGSDLIECDSLAACCALVRPDAIRRTGLFPDVFINGDDSEWFVRMGQKTGGMIAADPVLRAYHPRFDRHSLFPRYYHARNGFGVMAALGLGAGARFRRGLLETKRAINQSMLGRQDLASLHLLGLRDAAKGITRGPCPHDVGVHPTRDINECLREAGLGPIEALTEAKKLEERKATIGSLVGAALRFVFGRRPNACVPAIGRPASWLRARKAVITWERDGWSYGFVSKTRKIHFVACAADSLYYGLKWSLRLALNEPELLRLAKAPGVPRTVGEMQRPKRTKLSVVVLSRNREKQLLWTVAELGVILGIDISKPPPGDEVADHEIVVVLNNSADASEALLSERCPAVKLVVLDENLGVEGFNRGVNEAAGEYVLILDDDAWPDVDGLEAALSLLDREPDIAAVALHPVHPDTKRSEWQFARIGGHTVRKWPVMGSGNLVRRRDWLAAGGYESSYRVYRNDTDMALKLLSMRRGVAFNANWIVWHNSYAASKKPLAWHRLATRNWVWTAKRHGGFFGFIPGALYGWAWAHRCAGFGPVRHLWTLLGAAQGFLTFAPELPSHIRPDERMWSELVRLKRGLRR